MRVEATTTSRRYQAAWRAVHGALHLLPLGALFVASRLGLAAVQQEGVELDAGRFEIRSGGRVIGTEVFAIRRVGSTVRAVGRIQAEAASGLTPFEVRLQTDSQLRPDVYELRIFGDHPRTVVGRSTDGGLVVRTVSEAGERFKELPLAPGATILERNTAHHFFFLFQEAHAGGTGADSVPVLIPGQSIRTSAVIHRVGPSSVTIGGTDRPATHYQVFAGETNYDVWIDSGGRVLQVQVPAANWVATRLQGDDHGEQ